jgi:transcriptional regulator GlxA family with amidase domain
LIGARFEASVKFDIIRGYSAMTLLVEVHVLAGAMPSSVAITTDVLATANRLRALQSRPPIFRIQLSGSGARAARAFLGVVGNADTHHPADIIVVPGLGVSTEEEIRLRMSRPDISRAKQMLERAAANGGEIATSCSGVFLLASTGLLDGRRATTSWWLAPLFGRFYPRVQLETGALVVRDDRFVSAGAAMAQMDLMLSLVARHADAALANQCSRYLLLDQRRSQSRYMALGFLASVDPHVARAEAWARDRLHEEFTVDELAAAAGLAPRTFARRVRQTTGLSPVRFIQRLRVDAAVALLETTKLIVDEVAIRVGYAEPSTLRRLIRRDSGRLPRELRVQV